MASGSMLQPAIRLRAFAGPLVLNVRAQNEAMARVARGVLRQFDVRWSGGLIESHVSIRVAQPSRVAVRGDYLRTYRTTAGPSRKGLWAVTPGGGACRIEDVRRVCCIRSPSQAPEIALVEDLEQLLMLFIVRSWRLAGWTPLHAASAVRGAVGLAVCAPGSTGKTTLIAALMRRGWCTIGDDKLLVRVAEGGVIEVRAVSHQFHLDPRTTRFFPEISGIEEHPTYSRWTPKRQVPANRFWPGRLLERGTINRVVRLAREPAISGIRLAPMSAQETLGTLLSQVVIPNETREARMIIATMGRLASNSRGLSCSVGEDAFADERNVSALEEALA